MAAVRVKSQTVALLASLLVCGCKFYPEQALLPGERTRMPTEGVAALSSPPRGSTASAVSGAGRGADPARPPSVPSTMTAAPSGAAAGSAATSPGSASKMEAGIGTSEASARMSAQMSSAGSSAMSAAGGGAAGAGGEDKPMQAKDPTCDLSGVWITKQLSASKALEEVGFSNGYAYYEIEQSGSDFVVKKHIDCGGIALGGGTAYLSRPSLQALTRHNSQSGRKGHVTLVDGKCALDIEHFWSVRGADEMRFLPTPTRNSTLSLAEMQKQNPLPTPNMLDGAEDWENDGVPGVASQLSGILSGVRNGCQRDWDRWFTAPGYEITPSLDFTSDLTIRFEFEGEESVIAPTSGLLATLSEPATEYPPVMRFRFLGRTTDDPRAQAIVKAEPVDTCYAIQDAIPAEEATR